MGSGLRLEKLSEQQLRELPQIREEWLGHGLSTAPADRSRAEAGVREAYRAAGLEPPPIIVWLHSPFEGVIGTAILKQLLLPPAPGGQVRDQVGGQVGGQVRDQVGGQVRGQVRGQVGGQVRGQVWGQVRGQVGGQVRDQVGGQVRDQVWGQVGGQVRGQVGDQVGDQVRAIFNQTVFGQHDAGWLSWIDTFKRFGLECTEQASGLIEVGRSAGWWWPMQGAVVLTERPTALFRDEDGRLHNTSGPAISYPDGWSIYVVHGVRVPEQVIKSPDSMTAEQIRNTDNIEVRRVMIEQFGHERFVAESGAQIVQEDDTGKLYRTDVPDDESIVVVEVQNSTPEPDGSTRSYMLRVPPTTRTAREGVAWTFDVPPSDYDLAAQT